MNELHSLSMYITCVAIMHSNFRSVIAKCEAVNGKYDRQIRIKIQQKN